MKHSNERKKRLKTDYRICSDEYKIGVRDSSIVEPDECLCSNPMQWNKGMSLLSIWSGLEIQN